ETTRPYWQDKRRRKPLHRRRWRLLSKNREIYEMGQIDGFMKFNREMPKTRDPKARVRDYKEIYLPQSADKINQQAARCMDCGVPFCHNGCPLGNVIPDFNDAVYRGKWE